MYQLEMSMFLVFFYSNPLFTGSLAPKENCEGSIQSDVQTFIEDAEFFIVGFLLH